MRKHMPCILYISAVIVLSKAEVYKQCYQRKYRFKSFGSMTSANKILFSGDGGSFPAAVRECTEFCRGDRRCIWMEICSTREDKFRCRVCCEWKKLGEEAELTNDTVACKYYEMEEKKEETVNIAVSKFVTLSSKHPNNSPGGSNAVDGVIECNSGYLLAHTKFEFQPWLKIDLQLIYDVSKVIIYNRQDCCGERLHDVKIDIRGSGTNAPCGFFKGPADAGDRIAVYCASGSVGRYVFMTILSPEIWETLNVCEVQVFVDV